MFEKDLERCGKVFFSVGQRIFLPESTFSGDFLAVSINPLCAIARINLCAHVKDSVVHVRVRWNYGNTK